MLQGEHSAILSTFIKLPFVIKVFVLSYFDWQLRTGFTVYDIEWFNFLQILVDVRNMFKDTPSLVDITIPEVRKHLLYRMLGTCLKILLH